MKKLVSIFVLGFIAFSFGAFEQIKIKVDCKGNVVINSTRHAYFHKLT